MEDMEPSEIRLTSGESRYKVEIRALVTTDGVSLTIIGGEKPHVGGVAMSLPRTSLEGNGLSCDTWVNPVPGHKDTRIAVPVAEMVARETGRITVVVAGIHINEALPWEIEQIMENAMDAARLMVKKIKEILGDQQNA